MESGRPGFDPSSKPDPSIGTTAGSLTSAPTTGLAPPPPPSGRRGTIPSGPLVGVAHPGEFFFLGKGPPSVSGSYPPPQTGRAFEGCRDLWSPTLSPARTDLHPPPPPKRKRRQGYRGRASHGGAPQLSRRPPSSPAGRSPAPWPPPCRPKSLPVGGGVCVGYPFPRPGLTESIASLSVLSRTARPSQPWSNGGPFGVPLSPLLTPGVPSLPGPSPNPTPYPSPNCRVGLGPEAQSSSCMSTPTPRSRLPPPPGEKGGGSSGLSWRSGASRCCLRD